MSLVGLMLQCLQFVPHSLFRRKKTKQGVTSFVGFAFSCHKGYGPLCHILCLTLVYTISFQSLCSPACMGSVEWEMGGPSSSPGRDSSTRESVRFRQTPLYVCFPAGFQNLHVDTTLLHQPCSSDPYLWARWVRNTGLIWLYWVRTTSLIWAHWFWSKGLIWPHWVRTTVAEVGLETISIKAAVLYIEHQGAALRFQITFFFSKERKQTLSLTKQWRNPQ